MPEITIKVDPTTVAARLERMGPLIRERVRDTIQREGIALQRLTKEKLSGPVLRNRTGRLRRSINFRLTETPNAIVGTVGTNVRYARAHEYGFEGTVSVREHTRTVTMAFGRPIDPVDAVVRAHTAHMLLPERSFLRSSLSERAPSIANAIREAVRGAVQGSAG